MLDELQNGITTHQRRMEIGQWLAKNSDTRAGVSLLANGLPDIAWCSVEGGDISVESKQFIVDGFYIAQYPVTFVQYQAFVDADDGYTNPRWWHDFPEDYRHQPLVAQNQPFSNHPRDNLSWFQAVAYSRWVNAHCKPADVPDDWVIRLPLEQEWQWAAQAGNEQRDYPFGEWQAGYANTAEAGLDCTIAVGMYPQGAAECGAMDMAGNVWEWCLNDFEVIRRVDYGGESKKIRRGGSYNFPASMAHTARRDIVFPFTRSTFNGMRLVLARVITDSTL